MAFTLLDDEPVAAVKPAKGKFVLLDDEPQQSDPVKDAINKSGSAGLIDAGLALGTGAVAGPVSGLAGIAGTLLPGPKGQGAAWVNKTQDALSYEPKTEIGQGITKAITYPFQKLAEGADIAGAATATATGSPAAGAGVNTAIQAIPLALGRVAPVGEGAASLAKRTAAQAKNAQYDAGTIAAKDAGYTLPPTQANPSLMNKVLEGIAGKAKTAQTASLKNQDVTNGLIKKSLGVAEDAPLTVESLQAIRKNAGGAYERVRSAGNVTADPAYAKTLDSIAAPFERASKDFPDAARTDIIDAVKAARRESFDASSAVDQISILRDKADTAFASKDKNLGKAYKGIANALEEQIGRHLEKVSPNALEDFQKARKTIAQTYTVEKHLKTDGNVDAVGLARELKRKPLEGDMRTVAKFGEQFPKAAQKPESVGGVNAISPLDVGVGGLMSVITHNPAALAALAGRPIVRSAILSKLYQDNAVNPQSYGPSAVTRLQKILGESQRNQLVPLTETSLGQRQ